MKNKLLTIFEKLYAAYGPQHWWPAETPLEMMIGAILVQNTNWRNVEKAISRLKPYLTPETLNALSPEELAVLIRPSGFYRLKSKRIKALLEWLETYDFQIEQLKRMEQSELREQLLSVNGVGKETADSILVYAFEKRVFIVDAYTRRIFYRIGIDLPGHYDVFREEVGKLLPQDIQIYNEFHALLVKHAKTFCKKKPLCGNCPLKDLCKQRTDN